MDGLFWTAEALETDRMVRLRCPVMVGREDEARVCGEALASLSSGTGEMLAVTGAAGIGKSRLCQAVLEEAVRRAVPVGVGRAVPTAGGLPYRPLAQLVAQLRQNQRAVDDPRLASWLEPDLDGATRTAGGTSPVVYADALAGWLSQLAGPGGLLVVLEDLHWADRDTLEILDSVADAVVGYPVLWLLTGRDDYDTGFMGLVDRFRERRGVRHLPLVPLTDGQVAQMADACRPGVSGQVLDRVRRSAEGVPLFVEELIASPGLPQSFAAAVRRQLTGLDPVARGVLAAAAVLGRFIDVGLLPEMAELPAETVAGGLQEAVARGLLVDDDGPLRFRHALTREAVAGQIPPAQRRALAAAALRAVQRTQPGLGGEWLPVAAELAAQAGDDALAGRLLAETGQRALSAGALATAVDALRRALSLMDGDAAAETRLVLVRALTVTGHVDEALAAGRPLLQAGTEQQRAEVLLALASAAVAGERWAAAASYLDTVPTPALVASGAQQARHQLMSAQVALADHRLTEAGELTDRVLAADGADAEDRCRALELRGRIARLNDLAAARDAFEQALQLAETTGLPLRRLAALHELGTLELFDSAGTARLSQAHALAEQMGAAGTVAVLDLQLTAAHLSRFDADAAEQHAEAARAWGERLGLHAVTAKAWAGLAEVAVQRRQAEQMEHRLATAAAISPDDELLEAFGWGQCCGMLAMFEDDWPRALDCFARAMQVLRRFGTAEPLEFRALWPLLLAADGDPRAGAALAAANTPNLIVAFANRGLLGYAEAILAGRAGQAERAAELARRAGAYLVRFPVWRDLARLCAAPSARADGWGQPEPWLENARGTFTALGLTPLADRCERLLRTDVPATSLSGVTARENEVLGLLVHGLANKEIGARLQLSPRTVEKHVESLMRKTGARSRTQLAGQAAGLTAGKNT